MSKPKPPVRDAKGADVDPSLVKVFRPEDVGPSPKVEADGLSAERKKYETIRHNMSQGEASSTVTQLDPVTDLQGLSNRVRALVDDGSDEDALRDLISTFEQETVASEVDGARNKAAALANLAVRSAVLVRAEREQVEAAQQARELGATWAEIAAAALVSLDTARRRFDLAARDKHREYQRERARKQRESASRSSGETDA